MNSAPTNTDDSINEAAQNDKACAADSDRLMAEFSIVQRGRYYWCEGYRYDYLADAVAYAQVVRSRRSLRANPSLPTRSDIVESPNESDRQLMMGLSIAFENGRFVFENHHYDHLIDAVNYARLRQDSRVDGH